MKGLVLDAEWKPREGYLLDLSPVITARYSLDNVLEGIVQSRARRHGKIVVKP
jgi:hypothetical protein